MRHPSILLAATMLIFPALSWGQPSRAPSQGEWERLVETARKEGKVVVSIPASAELRRELDRVFRQRFGMEIELVAARGTAIVRRIVEEHRAGIRYFDLHLGGSLSTLTGLLPERALEPIDAHFVRPDVKDPKNWWGGHLWVDRAKRHIYSFQAYLTESVWYNTNLVKPEELRSYDDFLNPKWKGRIGFLDPRTPGAGDANWSYLWSVKGEDYLRRLIEQDLLLNRDQRLLAEQLAKEKVAVVIGLTHYSYLPFLQAGLPIKPLPTPREGGFGTGGSGNLSVIKNPPHPSAAKVFTNWLLSKEGQETFTRALGQATRRLDVDTRYLKEVGVLAAKDHLTLKQYLEVENQSEDKLDKVREPALKVAQKLLR